MKTASIAWGCICALLVLAAAGPTMPSAHGAPINVLVIANDPNIGTLTSGLYAYGDINNISTINWSAAPDLAAFSGFNAIVVTSFFTPLDNSKAWGDLIADYAHAGGAVVAAFAFYNTNGPVTDYGRLQLPAYNPFTRGPRIGDTTGVYTNTPPNPDPLMAGVNSLITEYRYDIAPTATPGAHVVANFDDGVPLAGYRDVGSGHVVGIQAHYKLNPFFANSGDYMQLYHNAILRAIPEPATAVSVLGLITATCIPRRRR